MRRFSQRSSLVTLSEINITPLLDLAFVLLIIFVITTPLLEKGLELNLPRVQGQAAKTLNRNDLRTVEITRQGTYALKGHPLSLSQLIRELAVDQRMNPNLVVYLRADKKCEWDAVAALISACQQNGILRISPRVQPLERP